MLDRSKRRLLVATNNASKAKEIKHIFLGLYDEVATLKDIGSDIEIVEDGNSFLENARIKATAGFEQTGYDCLADDSGLCVDALDGAPGIYSARFSSENATDMDNNQLLLKKLNGIPFEKRTAKFACAVCLIRKDMPEINAYGQVGGIILEQPRGNNGFGYDPYFYVSKYDMSMAELEPQVKNKISHRANALNELKRKLND